MHVNIVHHIARMLQSMRGEHNDNRTTYGYGGWQQLLQVLHSGMRQIFVPPAVVLPVIYGTGNFLLSMVRLSLSMIKYVEPLFPSTASWHNGHLKENFTLLS